MNRSASARSLIAMSGFAGGPQTLILRQLRRDERRKPPHNHHELAKAGAKYCRYCLRRLRP